MQIRQHTAGQGAATSPPSFCTRPARWSHSTSWKPGPIGWRTTSAGMACVEGDAVAILMENNEHIHAVMWAARRGRAVLRADQHAPDRRRGGLHRRQQRRQGDRRIGRAAQDLRGLAEHLPGGLPELLLIAAMVTSTAGSVTPNVLPINRIRRSTTRSRATCCSTRRAPPAGPRASNASCRTCSPAEAPGHDVGAGRVLDAPRHGLSESGAAVSHRAVGVVDDRAGRRHHHRRDGEVRSRRLPGRHPAPPGDARPVRPGDVRPDAETT